MADSRKHRKSGVQRRWFLQVTGAAGTAGLAGCSGITGDGGDDGSIEYDDRLVIVSHESGSAGNAAMQGMAATVNEHTDKVRLDAPPSSGPADNVGRMDRGEAHIGQVQDWVINAALEGEDPYGELSFSPQQVFTLYTVPWLFVTANENIQEITDIGSDTGIVIGPGGSGTRDLFRKVLSLYDVTDYQIKDIPFTDQASAFADGRIDVGLTNVLNSAVEPGWVQEIKATTDQLGIVRWPDGGQALVDNGVVGTQEWDISDYHEGYELYEPPKMYTSVLESYNFIARHDVPEDLLSAVLETSYDNREEMAERHALLTFYGNDEFWVSGIWDDVPFHPSAANFYQDMGIWNDNWSIGD